MANFESVVVAVLAMDTEDYIEERVNKKDTKVKLRAKPIKCRQALLCCVCTDKNFFLKKKPYRVPIIS